MNEAKFQSEFTRWLKQFVNVSAAFELKFTKNGRIPFSSVQEHQIQALLRAKHGVLAYKISDMGLGYKPFDCFSLSKSEAFVVVMFFVPKKKHLCYLIDVDDFIKEAEHSERKSLTEDRAAAIATLVAYLYLKGGEKTMEGEEKKEEVVEGSEVAAEEAKAEEATPKETPAA